MSQKAPTGFRLDDDIDEAIRVRIARERTTMTRVVNSLLRAWIADQTINNSTPRPIAPQPDILDDLNALARKLSAAKAEVEHIIARTIGGMDEDAGDLLADSGRAKAHARAIVGRASRGSGVPGGIEGGGAPADRATGAKEGSAARVAAANRVKRGG